jgi:hypothetical protein
MSRVKSSIKPETERILSELQETYLQNRNEEDYHKMFTIVVKYAKSLILILTRGKMFLPPDLVEEAAVEAGSRLMASYKKEGFHIASSFAGLLRLKCLECIYGPAIRRADNIWSLNEHIENGKSADTELGDLSESFGFKYLWQADSESYSNPLYHIVDKNADAINSATSVLNDFYMNPDIDLHTYYLVALGLLKKVQGNKSYYAFIDAFMNPEQIQVLEMVELELSQRLRESA